MNYKGAKISCIIILVGIVLAVFSCLLTGMLMEPEIKEQEFSYSVTYELGGEIKTFNGVYKCQFVGMGSDLAPLDRIYEGEYSDYGLAEHTYAYTVAQKGEYDLCIVTSFNDSYLMGDTTNDYYEDTLEDPYLAIYDAEGVCYEDAEMLLVFDAQIIEWDYPEPIENSFSFAGFSRLHFTSMVAMLFVGLLVIVACLIFVRNGVSALYTAVDKLGILLNFAIVIFGIPFATLVSAFVQAFPVGADWIYQVLLCVPAIMAFSVAMSLSLRRCGYSKFGFFIQFIGPLMFVACALLESVVY